MNGWDEDEDEEEHGGKTGDELLVFEGQLKRGCGRTNRLTRRYAVGAMRAIVFLSRSR